MGTKKQPVEFKHVSRRVICTACHSAQEAKRKNIPVFI